MSQIKHVVFDVGRVLLHWDPELIYLDLIPDVDKRKEFLNSVCTPQWNVEQDRGRSWKVAEDELITNHPDKVDLIRAFRANWIKSIPHAFDDIADVYQRLIESGRDVTLLTNFHQDTFLEAKTKFNFLNNARAETVSGLVQVIKPDPAIYELHTKSHGLDREATLFIDDSANNISAARSFGWKAIHFAGPQGASNLVAALQEHGISL